MNSGIFSVIIPAYKMGGFIGEALESVGAQTCRDWEVIVVDDCGPDDGTEKIVQDFAKVHPEHRVEFIRHVKNTGVSGARNTALDAATGEWAAFLDPDDLWLDHHLSTALDIINQSPDVSLITGPVISFVEQEAKRIYSHSHWTIPAWKINSLPASLAYHNFIQPSATIVRTSLVKEVGGFDISPELQHIEDYDLWIRLAEQNARFVFTSSASCHYRKHSGAATHNEALMQRLHMALTIKHLHFFVRMQSILQNNEANLNADYRNRLRGPIMRIVIKLDQLISKWLAPPMGN
jgi:glycosyltransferase involved in cell wall biosynthesis